MVINHLSSGQLSDMSELVRAGNQVNSGSSGSNQLKLSLSNIPKQAADCFSNGIGLDLDIVVTEDGQEHTIKASKFMLGCNSPFFCAMFSGQWKEAIDNQWKIKPTTDSEDFTDLSTIKLFIAAMHGVEVHLSDLITAIRLSALCRMYEVDELARQVKYFITSGLNKTNVIEVLVYAHRNGYDEIKALASSFIRSDKFGKLEELSGLNDLDGELSMVLAKDMRDALIAKK